MQINALKVRPNVFIAFLIIVAFVCQPSLVGGASILTTEKDIYNYGETIKVNFSNSPGNASDWICIVPVGSPDTEGGDYKNIPKGWSQGVLTFDPPAPGKYEARAYYNYSRNGYVVSGRYAFSVVSSPEGEAAMAQRMERKIDPNNPLEANLPPGQGLIYIFRESWFFSYNSEVQIKASGKPIIFMRNASYFPFSTPSGDVTFTSGVIRENLPNSNIETEASNECKATIKVKSGYVYYLKLRSIEAPIPWVLFLDHVPHQEGANIIQSNKLTLLKR